MSTYAETETCLLSGSSYHSPSVLDDVDVRVVAVDEVAEKSGTGDDEVEVGATKLWVVVVAGLGSDSHPGNLACNQANCSGVNGVAIINRGSLRGQDA